MTDILLITAALLGWLVYSWHMEHGLVGIFTEP